MNVQVQESGYHYEVMRRAIELIDAGGETLTLEELAAHGWNMAKTAQGLGINRSTLWRKMKKYGL